jgi:ribosomal protein S12 methylthiotransferase
VNAEVIEAIATTPKVCQYIDMPLQHADDDILRAMKRPMSGDKYLQLLERFRDASPDIAIRTTFIVGFPGETETHFDNLLRFVDKAQFDRAGVFEYSVEDGTPSADLPDRVPARVKRSRKDRLMRLQQQVSLTRHQKWIGREMEVLIERESDGVLKCGSKGGKSSEVSEYGSNGKSITPSLHHSCTPFATGRSFRDAPEIDGQVFVSSASAVPGKFINVRITEAKEYDLVGIGS